MNYRIKRFSGINSDEKNIPEIIQPTPDLGRLRRKLQEQGYSDREISLILDEFRRIEHNSEEAEVVQKWIETGEVDNKEVREKMERDGLQFPAAFLELYNKVQRHYSILDIFKQNKRYEGKVKNATQRRREYYDSKTSPSRKYEILLDYFPSHTSPLHLQLLEIEKKVGSSEEGSPKFTISFENSKVKFENFLGRNYNLSWTEEFGWLIDYPKVRVVENFKKECLEIINGEIKKNSNFRRYLELLKNEFMRL